MAGGAALVSDLLQGAFGGNNITPDQAAQASGYTHKQTLDEATSQPLDKPRYWGSFPDPNNPGKFTQDVTDDPLSKLPAKQPNFWQRAFAPNDAARANAINSSFVGSPQATLQSDRTQSLIGAGHTAKTQALISSGIPLTQADPESVNEATGGDASIGGINRGQIGADFYNQGGPAIQTSSDIQAAKAGSAVNTNVATRAGVEATNGTPEQQAEAEFQEAKARAISSEGEIQNIPARTGLTAKNLALEGGMADTKLSHLPQLQRTLGNQIENENLASIYSPSPPPWAVKNNGDGTFSEGPTGFTSAQMGAIKAMQTKGLSVTTKDGKTVNLPPPPARMFDSSGNTITPTVASPIKSQEDEGFKTDEQGNVWYKGHIIATAAQRKMNQSTELLDSSTQNYDPSNSPYLNR